MTDAMSWEVASEETSLRLVLRGVIDEEADFAPVLALLEPHVVVDMQGIERINSIGVRIWTQFLAAAEGSGTSLEFEACSPAIVHQLNMITNFFGRGTVRSVMAPYMCGECEHFSERKIDMTDDHFEQVQTPIVCPTCDGAMEFDDLPEIYFGFLASRQD